MITPKNPTQKEKEKMRSAIQHIKVMVHYHESGKVSESMCLDRIMVYAHDWENE